MAEYICFFKKDIVLKPPKKSSLYLTMVVLVFTMVWGVYICTICINQISNVTKQSNQVEEKPFLDYYYAGTKRLERPHLHYPKPKSFRRAECVHTPVRFFVILSMQRSGSGWFETLLNSHKNVSSNGEIFSVIDRRKNISSIIKSLDKVYNLDFLTSAAKNECSAAIGFKWMLNQGLMEYHTEILEYFERRGVSVVFLFRKNLLRRMVSLLANSYDRYAKLLNGTHQSHVHSEEEANRLSKYKPKINPTSLIHDLEEVENTAIKAFEYYNNTRHIVLYYEDIMKNHTKLKDVQEFLSIPLMDLTSRQVKIHKGPLSDHILNWNEVYKTLIGTKFERFLNAYY